MTLRAPGLAFFAATLRAGFLTAFCRVVLAGFLRRAVGALAVLRLIVSDVLRMTGLVSGSGSGGERRLVSIWPPSARTSASGDW